jgi:hypothetical protein
MESVRRMRIFSQMSDAEVIDLLERARSFLTRRRRRG